MTAPLPADTSAPGAVAPETDSDPGTVRAIFHVTAQADPGMASRLIEPFARLGLVPARVHISSEDGAGEEITADLRTHGVSPTHAHLIAKALSRTVGVRQVLSLTE